MCIENFCNGEVLVRLLVTNVKPQNVIKLG